MPVPMKTRTVDPSPYASPAPTVNVTVLVVALEVHIVLDVTAGLVQFPLTQLGQYVIAEVILVDISSSGFDCGIQVRLFEKLVVLLQGWDLGFLTDLASLYLVQILKLNLDSFSGARSVHGAHFGGRSLWRESKATLLQRCLQDA